MPTFIKTGLWFKSRKGYEGSLNLDDLIKENSGGNYQDFSIINEPPSPPVGHIRIWMNTSGVLMTKDHTGIVKEIQYVNL